MAKVEDGGARESFQVSCTWWPDEESRLHKCMYMGSAKVDINHLGSLTSGTTGISIWPEPHLFTSGVARICMQTPRHDPGVVCLRPIRQEQRSPSREITKILVCGRIMCVATL